MKVLLCHLYSIVLVTRDHTYGVLYSCFMFYFMNLFINYYFIVLMHEKYNVEALFSVFCLITITGRRCIPFFDYTFINPIRLQKIYSDFDLHVYCALLNRYHQYCFKYTRTVPPIKLLPQTKYSYYDICMSYVDIYTILEKITRFSISI